LVGCASLTPDPSSTPEPSPPAPLQPLVLSGPKDGVKQAVLMEALTPRWGPTPDGPELLDDFGENANVLDAGRRVVLLGDPQHGPDGTWVRVWVVPDPSVGLGNFSAWLPDTQMGRATLRKIDSAACPALATIGSLAPLLPPDRFRCVGRTKITIDARSWLPVDWPNYDVAPAWYGTNADPGGTVSLFDGGPTPFGPDSAPTPNIAGAWIEARIPPTVDEPPRGMYLRVTGQFGDPSAEQCTRTPNRAAAPAPPGFGLPPEAPADSVEWCRGQFVVSDWEILLGPEGRPIDLSAPQLHRPLFQNVPPGVPVACGGVGMPPLTVRIDPSRVDPVWIQTPGGGTSIAIFDRAFQLVPGEPPRVVGQNGVSLIDGEILDPDRGKPGLAICPGGEVVDFWVAPPGGAAQP
jgi:hypothetical protein